ncbi:MAG TPA: M1 family aminopeptidase [Vicinamibacterales bacterium]|nr:M1 family aminopeptidase [Vicinamibacterales bacterium]
MPLGLILACALFAAAPARAEQPDPVGELLARLHAAAAAGDRGGIRALGSDLTTLSEFAVAMTTPAPTRLVLKARDRTPLEDGGHRVLLEVFWERGIEGRLSTWSVDVREQEGALRITAATRLAQVTGLYRLTLDLERPYQVRNLTVRGPDLALHIPSGTAFAARTPEGATAVVLLGAGQMQFTPPEPAERTQVRIFSGNEALVAPFEAAFIRVRPEDFAEKFPEGTLIERPAPALDVRRAQELFEEYVGRTLQINLTDLTEGRWSITPQPGDMIAEIRTPKFGTLTYARSGNDPEDISVFHRQRRRNISVYASAEKRAVRGRFYSEDDLVEYDILAYDIEAAISPDRARIEGTARLKVRIRAASATTLNLRLAEDLTVSGVYSQDFGRLLHLRVVNQHSLIVSLPGTMIADSELWLTITYAGPLPSQELEREAIAVQQDTIDAPQIPPEPRFIYSNRSFWYPQSVVSDYATSRLSIIVPAGYDVVATGIRRPQAEAAAAPAPGAPRARQVFHFESERPVRYLAVVISRLRDVGSALAPPAREGADGVPLHFLANPRQTGRARGIAARATEIYGYYASLVADAPYPSFTVTITERELPGGHSPAYFAVVDQPTQGAVSWRNDPVAFDTYPDFFLAHEIAHQWWGQAIGWKNYHEQWISEGFAQYFATLYAEQRLPAGVVTNVMRRMRQTAIAQSPQGPVYLGYRLGHVQGDPRVFRSIVYNKGAMVLHMLRRIVGDETFFRGLRNFYAEWKYRKAGTGDFQAAMEAASGRDLSQFFDGWVFGSTIPHARFSHRMEGLRLVMRVEQRDTAMEFPITVRLTYGSGRVENRVMVATGQITEETIELKEKPRSVSVNPDHGTLAVFR